MGNDVFRVKLVISNNTSYSGVSGYIKSLMMKKFMYPTKPNESDIVIKGYWINHSIFLEAYQRNPIYKNIDDFIRELCITYEVASYELDFNDVDHSFFDEFQVSFSSVFNVKNGIKKLINIICDATIYVTEEEKNLESYREFIINHNHIIRNDNNTKEALSKYLISYSRFFNDLDFISSAGICFWGTYERIHTDEYTAQEHYKEFIKAVHLKLKPLGFKKKGTRFTLKQDSVEKLVWMQRKSGATKSELEFTINFENVENDIPYRNFRIGDTLPPRRDRWWNVNIHIDTEKSLEVLDVYMDALLEILLSHDDNESIASIVYKDKI